MRLIADSVPPGDHDVRIAQRDHARGVADGVRTGRAGRHGRVVGALQPVLDRDIAGGQVAQAGPGMKKGERRRGPRSLSTRRGVVDAAQAADAGTDARRRSVIWSS